MAMSSRIELRTLCAGLVLGAATAAAAANDCNEISSTFFVSHWQGPLPSSVTVQVLKPSSPKDSVSIPYQSRLWNSAAGDGDVILILKPQQPVVPRFLVSDDYRILVDEKIEYRIHDIVVPDRLPLGCPVASAAVNDCKAKPGKAIGFDSECGRPPR